MYTAIATQELIDLIRTEYSVNTHTLSVMAAIKKIMIECLDKPFGQNIQAYIGNVQGKIHANQLASHLSALGSKVSEHLKDDKAASELKDLASKSRYVADGLQHNEHPRKYLPTDSLDKYISSLDRPIQKVGAFMAYTAGLKRSELFLDIEGIYTGNLDIYGRKITFDNTYILDEIDPEGEVRHVLEARLKQFNNNAAYAGKASNELDGMEFCMNELRDCHAINLIQSGMDTAEVAKLQGVKRQQLIDRIEPTCLENRINLTC